MTYRPSFTVALSLTVFVLVIIRCFSLWVPNPDPSHDPIVPLYAQALLRAALEALIVLFGSHVGMRLARPSAADVPPKAAVFLAVPLAAIGLLQGQVHIRFPTDCPEGIVCNPYGWDSVLEWYLHYIVLFAASALVVFLAGRSFGKSHEAKQP